MFRVLIVLAILCTAIGCVAQPLAEVRTIPLPGTVALTFDDGPSPVDTPKILAILKKYNIKATFFVMGPLAKQYPHLIQQIIADGHAIGLHTMSHKDLTTLSPEQLHFEVTESKNILHALMGKNPVCLRPPYGAVNDAVTDYIQSQNLNVILLGLNSFDFERPGAKKIESWVIKQAKANTMILMHDGYQNREQTVEALPGIIEGIQHKGIGFSAICYPQNELI